MTNAPVRAQWTSFEIPTPGCWAITGRAKDLELTIVVEVPPYDDRSNADEEFAAAFQLRDEAGSSQEVTNIEIRGDYRLVRITFPEAGCWTLEFSAGSRVASFTVYVFPAA